MVDVRIAFVVGFVIGAFIGITGFALVLYIDILRRNNQNDPSE